VLVVANTQMLSASERTKEIGTLTALGAPRKLVRRMFILESFLLGLVAAILGATICIVTARVGIPFKPPNQPVVLVRPIASIGSALVWASVATVVAVSGALLPSWIAARKQPLEALRL
jgi:ABC-type antimicrobial peptide transport system permease subunit